MYELSYCYYDANQVEKAIEGFKQLSNEKDSLGQNSMYLLGDLYLRTNQKANARNAFQYSADNSSNRTATGNFTGLIMQSFLMNWVTRMLH